MERRTLKWLTVKQAHYRERGSRPRTWARLRRFQQIISRQDRSRWTSPRPPASRGHGG